MIGLTSFLTKFKQSVNDTGEICLIQNMGHSTAKLGKICVK